MTVEQAIYMTGVIVWLIGGLVVLALAMLGASKLVNRVMWALLGCYGGIKVFNEFRLWHQAQREEST